MREACPRCGAERGHLAACPECGYEPEHPGVLGAYGDAARRIVQQPLLLLPFLVPALVLAGAEALLLQFGGTGTSGVNAPAHALGGLVALFLPVAWYLTTVGIIVPAVQEMGGLAWPSGPTIFGGILGGLLVISPWALILSLLVIQAGGALGAMALLAIVLLLISAIFVAGRAVGIPVEAALNSRTGMSLFREGNRRGRENGGLGLVFLAVLAIGVVTFSAALLGEFVFTGLPDRLLFLMVAVVRWPLGAWIGVAFAIGLVGIAEDATRRITCPACGQQATVKGGRARCECGLEGPYYSA